MILVSFLWDESHFRCLDTVVLRADAFARGTATNCRMSGQMFLRTSTGSWERAGCWRWHCDTLQESVCCSERLGNGIGVAQFGVNGVGNPVATAAKIGHFGRTTGS